ncbi:MAG: glycosyltransferase family 2 protein [Planctomycetales bacterium]|nr:glycosyltransferase family 2 protein [Planctomycetales bacterium]
MGTNAPLLSICVPTYNRAKFLRVMLQALLPQVAECGGQVEVWVIDNASTDDTPRVIEESRPLGAFRSVHNTENVGPIKNVVKGPAELATGEYVWVLGDHNLMMPGALRRVLEVFSDNLDLDVFYANFRCATYPDQWPVSATNGYHGEFQYLANESIADRPVAKWNELVRPESALCTQLYAHIVRTQVWRGYWKDKHIGDPYTDATTTYPHTMMLVDTLFHDRSYYIGLPTITIFNGAQSWGNPVSQAQVYLRGSPGLVRRLGDVGMTSLRIKDARRFTLPETHRVLTKLFEQKGSTRFVPMLILACFRYPYLYRIVCYAWVESRSDVIARCICEIRQAIANRHSWWIYNCRPVRWYRKQFLNRDSS